MPRFHPANLRAAWWAMRATRRTRRRLAAEGLDAALRLAPPPPLPAEAERGVRAALQRAGATCLVSAILLQVWKAAHGQERDLVVGVGGAAEFRAHAWLERAASISGEFPPEPAAAFSASAVPADQDAERFQELVRRPPR